MVKTVSIRNFVLLLALIALAEVLTMLALDAALGVNYPYWMRVMADAVMLAAICAPLLLRYQLHPLVMAHHDSLTGLPNRLLFNDRLAQALIVAKRQNKICAVIFMDLDRFKPVNDTYGHRIGDAVLKQVAERISRCVRASDTVARMGGDEFTVLLPLIESRVTVEMVMQKVEIEILKSFEVQGHHIELGVSAGIALYPEHGQDGVTLLDAADDAMYRAKNSDSMTCCLAT
jgi:diguanylate cyclase (GGDEF)-like protein